MSPAHTSSSDDRHQTDVHSFFLRGPTQGSSYTGVSIYSPMPHRHTFFVVQPHTCKRYLALSQITANLFIFISVAACTGRGNRDTGSSLARLAPPLACQSSLLSSLCPGPAAPHCRADPDFHTNPYVRENTVPSLSADHFLKQSLVHATDTVMCNTRYQYTV